VIGLGVPTTIVKGIAVRSSSSGHFGREDSKHSHHRQVRRAELRDDGVGGGSGRGEESSSVFARRDCGQFVPGRGGSRNTYWRGGTPTEGIFMLLR
jgi:hypothetical protein